MMTLLIKPDFAARYTVTMTNETDENYRSYLRRKLRSYTVVPCPTAPDAQPLDISLDDAEGDVIAGVAAYISSGSLILDLLWVDDRLRGRGYGRQLVRLAEQEAARRGCTLSRVGVAESAAAFYQKIGYTLSGRLHNMASGPVLCWLTKSLALDFPAQKGLA
jgi:GNAT superfamily N-acetyltransferase